MFSCTCKTSSETVANWIKQYVVLTGWIYRSYLGMHPFWKYFIDYKPTRKHIYLKCFKHGIPSQYMNHCSFICRKWFPFTESLSCAIFRKWNVCSIIWLHLFLKKWSLHLLRKDGFISYWKVNVFKCRMSSATIRNATKSYARSTGGAYHKYSGMIFFRKLFHENIAIILKKICIPESFQTMLMYCLTAVKRLLKPLISHNWQYFWSDIFPLPYETSCLSKKSLHVICKNWRPQFSKIDGVVPYWNMFHFLVT